ncbi:MAG: SAVED domain-containing protein [Desulfurobacteriaceae bacterium]
MSSIFSRILTKNLNQAVKYLEEAEKGNHHITISEIEEALEASFPAVRFQAVKTGVTLFRKELKELLKKIFNVEILNEEPLHFSFPVVSERERTLVNGIAILSDRTFSPDNPENLNFVSELTGKNFFVVFDKEFIGESYQAALSYTLLFGKIPQDFLLSGKVFKDGNFLADNLEEKRDFSKTLGKKLLGKGNIFLLNKVFEEGKVNIPFLITKGDESALRDLSKSAKVDLKILEPFLEIDDLVLKLPEYLPKENWLWITKSFKERIEKIIEEIPFIRKTFHFGFYSPSTLALGLGSVIGTGKIPCVVYHFENGNYVKVIDVERNSRSIKVRKEKLEFVEVKEIIKGKGGKGALVALQFASHEVRNKGKLIAEEKNLDYYYITIRNFKGAIPLDLNWNDLTSEIYEALNRVYDEGYEKIYLIMSMPVPLAFGVGMAIGSYWNVEVLNYFKEGYFPVLNLLDIEKI